MIEVSFILSVIMTIPTECSLYIGNKEEYCKPGTIGHYERGKDTRAIAEAIAKVAANEQDAIEMSVYAAYEGQNNVDALGDNGRSHGPWQTPFIRTTPEGYLADWIRFRNYSIVNCSHNSIDTKLAQLASGQCNRGTRKVSKRYQVVEMLLEKVSHHD